jgi:predicted nucleic acid-binding protein
VNAVDTSVVVAAFATWHEAYAPARAVLDLSPRLPAHAGLETYSVLTRFPAPNRAKAVDVRAFLRKEFPGPWLDLAGEAVPELIDLLVDQDIVGGATYDALVGSTAKAAGATLYTCDRRARLVYERIGVDVRFVG